ncbi:unnamed protein product [Candidula unifasciata]|uniref:SAFB-like transcription modulator n=1 Tax=Candidula unifasciata TaxID=100452 RepID=A0A8S3YKM1_9EUPU|nr:unnamed protein product [Candidula unifasciata]
MASVQKSILGDLQVNDIKKELEKRNLDKTGVKSVLIERLKKAIVSEGKDPNTFRFDVVDTATTASVLKGADEAGDLASKKTDKANGTSVSEGCDSEQLQTSAVSHVGEIGSNGAVPGNMPVEGKENGSQGKPNANASSTSQDSERPSTAKTNTGTSNITTPAKGKKSQSSIEYEGGDESFVVQEDDVVLNDIDSDLLDGEGKAPNSGSTGEPGVCGDANNGELDSTATADTSANLLENTQGEQTTAGSKVGKDTSEAKSSAQPVKKDEKASQAGRNLWVSGLSSSTRAADLKTLFSKHGKVVAAKVVTNARSPVSRCFGLVTLSSADDATKCVQQLHHTEFHGRKISIERAQTEIQGTKEKILPPTGLRSPTKPSAHSSTQGSETKAPRKDDERHHSRASTDNDRKRDELKIKADEVRDRLRRKEQYLEREKYKQRMIERKQWEEAQKIERERRHLREMREELERRQMETERLRLETERLHMEKEQEKYRKQQRALQERRAMKRRAPREEEWPNKHPAAERFHGGEGFREPREFNGRVEERRKFREERPPPREGRVARNDRPLRGGLSRHNSRSDWKSERGTWNGPIDNSKLDDGWGNSDMGQGDGWDNGMGMSQSSGGYALQQGQMISGMGTGTVFIAQPAVQTPSSMHNNMNRQSDGRFGMAAASVRRY